MFRSIINHNRTNRIHDHTYYIFIHQAKRGIYRYIMSQLQPHCDAAHTYITYYPLVSTQDVLQYYVAFNTSRQAISIEAISR